MSRTINILFNILIISYLTVCSSWQVMAQNTLPKPEIELVNLDELGFEGIIAFEVSNYSANEVEFELFGKAAENDGPFNMLISEYMPYDNPENPNEILHVFQPLGLELGEYEFALVAVNAMGERSELSNSVTAMFGSGRDISKEYIVDISDDNYGKGKRNQAYQFTVRGLDLVENKDISLVLLPNEYDIRMIGNEVNFVPEIGGKYTFEFKAENSDEYPDLFYTYEVLISECEKYTPLELTFVSEDGALYDIGYIELYPVAILDSINSGKGEGVFWENVVSAEIINGVAKVDDIDGGEYYYNLYVEGGEQSSWLEFEHDENGEIIIVNRESLNSISIVCDITNTDTIEVKRAYSSDKFDISGSIVVEDIPDMFRFLSIRAIGTNNENNINYHFYGEVYENGNFEMSLPVDLQYTIFAECIVFDETVGYEYSIVQYWKDAKTILDATQIDSSFVGNMEFVIRKPEPFENSITGTILDEDDAPIEEAQVIAFLLELDSEFENFETYIRFEGKPVITDESGNYSINDLVPGKYVIMAMPLDGRYTTGFYSLNGTVSEWSDATVLDIGKTSRKSSIDLVLSATSNSDGDGIIDGYVYVDGEKPGIIKQSDNGKGGVNVYAINLATGEMYSDMSNSDGYFIMNGVADGEYELSADRVGFNPDRKTVVVGGSQKESVSLTIKDITTSVEENFELNSVYPNPANQEITITLNSDINSSENILIISDINGKVVYQKMLDNMSNNVIVNVSTFGNGYYRYQIKSESATQNGSFLKR